MDLATFFYKIRKSPEMYHQLECTWHLILNYFNPTTFTNFPSWNFFNIKLDASFSMSLFRWRTSDVFPFDVIPMFSWSPGGIVKHPKGIDSISLWSILASKLIHPWSLLFSRVKFLKRIQILASFFRYGSAIHRGGGFLTEIINTKWFNV